METCIIDLYAWLSVCPYVCSRVEISDLRWIPISPKCKKNVLRSITEITATVNSPEMVVITYT